MSEIRFIHHAGRRPGLLAQIAGVVLGFVIFIVSLVLGAFLLAGILGFLVLAGSILFLRAWWLGRRLRREAADHGEVIEAEYRVISSEHVRRRDRD